jgi:hypothetical protein
VVAVSLTGFFVLFGFCIYCVWNNARLERGRDHAWEKKEQAWAAERQELLNRIMFLADRPWATPPAQEEVAPPDPTSYDPLMAPINDDSFDYYANPAGVV